MTSKPLTTRLPEWLERELRTLFRERGLGPSEGLRRVAEEWWVMKTFPAIEFRDGPAGRRAAIRGGPDVWEIVLVANEIEDRGELEAHFDWVEPDSIAQALSCYDRHPEPVDGMIEENARVARLLRGAS